MPQGLAAKYNKYMIALILIHYTLSKQNILIKLHFKIVDRKFLSKSTFFYLLTIK